MVSIFFNESLSIYNKFKYLQKSHEQYLEEKEVRREIKKMRVKLAPRNTLIFGPSSLSKHVDSKRCTESKACYIVFFYLLLNI